MTALDVEERRYRAAKKAGQRMEARRILLRMAALAGQADAGGGGAKKPARAALRTAAAPTNTLATIVLHSTLAYELGLDPRRLLRLIAGQPFYRRLGAKAIIVDRPAFEAWWRARPASAAQKAG